VVKEAQNLNSAKMKVGFLKVRHMEYGYSGGSGVIKNCWEMDYWDVTEPQNKEVGAPK